MKDIDFDLNEPLHKPDKLINRNFLLLWQGQFVSQLGSNVSTIALTLWIVNATNSATILGTLMMVAAIPGLVLAPIGGALADRIQRKRIIVFCDVLYGVLAVLLAALLFFLGPETGSAMVAVFVLYILMSITGAFFGPAVSALRPSLVPKSEIASANALTQSTSQLAGILGPAIGGILYRVLGAPVVFLIDGITYLISAASESFIRVEETHVTHDTESKPWVKLLSDTKAGFRFIWAWKGLRVLMVVAAALNFFAIPVFTFLPFYVKDARFLASSDQWFGYLMASTAVGTLVGFILAAVVIRKLKKFGVLVACLLPCMGILLYVLAGATSPILAWLVMGGIGVLAGMINNSIFSGIQSIVPSEKLGRVMGAIGALTGCSVPLAMGLGGIILDAIDQRIDLLFQTCAICFFLTAILAATNKDFRSLSLESSGD